MSSDVKTVRNFRLDDEAFDRIEEAARRLGIRPATFMARACVSVSKDVLADVPEPTPDDA